MMMMNDDDPMSMLIPRTCHSLSNNFKTRSQLDKLRQHKYACNLVSCIVLRA